MSKGFNIMTRIDSVCFLVISICLSTAFCTLYDVKSPVKTLHNTSFDQETRSHGVALVEFYRDSCDSCSKFSKNFEAVATALRDIVPVYAVNDAALSNRHNVTSFPTFKVFLGQGPLSTPKTAEYTGSLNVPDLITFTMKHLNKHVKSKVPATKRPESKATSGRVVQLSEIDFNNTVLNDTYNQWLIMFFAPWCGHCKALEPEWRRMATIAEKVKVGSVDATVSQTLAQRYNVKGYPTIVLLPQGSKVPSKAIGYNGARKAEEILAFARRHYKKMGPPLKVEHVADLQKHCSGPLCLLFFLSPDSVETHVDTISKVMEKNSSSPFEFCYTLAETHPQWEKALRITSFPALVGLNLSKDAYSTMRKERLTFDNVNTFVSEILSGRVSAERLSFSLRDDPISTEL